MIKILLLFFHVLSLSVYSKTSDRPDPSSSVNAEEQISGLPGGSAGAAYSVKTQKRSIKIPAIMAPAENALPASCADSLGGKGSANFTACEAARKTR